MDKVSNYIYFTERLFTKTEILVFLVIEIRETLVCLFDSLKTSDFGSSNFHVNELHVKKS